MKQESGDEWTQVLLILGRAKQQRQWPHEEGARRRPGQCRWLVDSECPEGLVSHGGREDFRKAVSYAVLLLYFLVLQ